MSRRNRVRNRRRKRRPNQWIILAQIAMLVGVLAFLYAFGDEIASGAGNLISQLTYEGRPTATDAAAESSTGREAPSLQTPEPSAEADTADAVPRPPDVSGE